MTEHRRAFDSMKTPRLFLQDPHVMPLWQAYPEVVVHSHEGRALADGGHAADQNRVDLRFAERRNESAERDVWRLSRQKQYLLLKRLQRIAPPDNLLA
jgi:hypothetical protein